MGSGRRNFRDIGGIPTGAGGRIRSRILFRSAAAEDDSHPSAEEFLVSCGIRRVIDLRATHELAWTELRWSACERHRLPLFEDVPEHWLAPVDRSPEATAERYLEMTEMGAESLARIVNFLGACDQHPTLIHCVAGRDRTGIVIACVLDVVGVDDPRIAADYALSHVMDDAEGRNADPQNILILLRKIRDKYGSTGAMLARFGAEEEALERLTEVLIEPMES